VWWASEPPPPNRKRTPHLVLLLSWDSDANIRDRIAVAPITSTIRGLEAEVFLDHNDGLPHGCVVNLDVIATILRSALDRRVVQLSGAKMREVDRAIHLALGISLPCGIS
jgi:mRNA-degrading endonuclease toxin of MazEF toxin-antitoxin module